MKFIGIVEKVVPDYAIHENENSRRFFMKLAAYDELLRHHAVYVRIQGQNAQRVLDLMDDSGTVHGIWQAELAMNVYEYPGKDGRTIYANLVHCTKIELVDPEYPDGRITDADRAFAAEIIPVIVNGEALPCVLQRKKSRF